MDIQDSLYEGRHVVLGPIDHDKDAEIEARWTHDADYLRLLSAEQARPLSAALLKKRYEAIEKEADEKNNRFYFTLRLRASEGQPEPRLIGFAEFFWIEWNNGTANLRLGIGDPQDRGRGYGREGLALLLRFAFHELNLHRLSVFVPAYNRRALDFFHAAGFSDEVCRRQALQRDGQRWDLLTLGLLRSEWEAGLKPAEA